MKNYQNKPVERTRKTRQFESAPVTKYMTMASDLITFSPDTDILTVVNTLLTHRIAGAPVLNDKKELVGLIDDKDCLRVLFDSSYHEHPLDKSTAADFMTNVMKTISADADIYDVADIFLTTVYKRLLVVDEGGKLAGQISRQDILKAIHDLNDHAR